MYKIIFIFLLVISSILFSCKKNESTKKDSVKVEFLVSVGLDNMVSFTLFNGTEELYSGNVVGENLKSASGHPIATSKQFNLEIPIDKVNNLIAKYGIDVKTREQGWGGWFQLKIDDKFYIDDVVITTRVMKNISLDNPKYGY